MIFERASARADVYRLSWDGSQVIRRPVGRRDGDNPDLHYFEPAQIGEITETQYNDQDGKRSWSIKVRDGNGWPVFWSPEEPGGEPVRAYLRGDLSLDGLLDTIDAEWIRRAAAKSGGVVDDA